ncbi:MAG: hypothetical protein KDA61_05075 [Planctomycetales bacterium]|nr:hypothetical protein [Planctomycetales bacterium]
MPSRRRTENSLRDAEFNVEIQYALLGLLLALNAALPPLHAGLQGPVPAPRSSLTAHALWVDDQAIFSLKVGEDVYLGWDRGASIERIDERYPQPIAAQTFTFPSEPSAHASPLRLRVWLARLPAEFAPRMSRPGKFWIVVYPTAKAVSVEPSLVDSLRNGVLPPATVGATLALADFSDVEIPSDLLPPE